MRNRRKKPPKYIAPVMTSTQQSAPVHGLCTLYRSSILWTLFYSVKFTGYMNATTMHWNTPFGRTWKSAYSDVPLEPWVNNLDLSVPLVSVYLASAPCTRVFTVSQWSWLCTSEGFQTRRAACTGAYRVKSNNYELNVVHRSPFVDRLQRSNCTKVTDFYELICAMRLAILLACRPLSIVSELWDRDLSL